MLFNRSLTSRLDALFNGITYKKYSSASFLQNKAAYSLTNHIHKYTDTSPFFRIVTGCEYDKNLFKTLTLTFKSLNNEVHRYIA